MNAGAYGGEMKDVLASVDVLTQDLEQDHSCGGAEFRLPLQQHSRKGLYIVLGQRCR